MATEAPAGRQLRIAWVGAGPSSKDTGGVPGVATALLHGLAGLGHRIDCFSPSGEHPLPPRLHGLANVTFVWGSSGWRWDRWYSRTKITAFVSGLAARALGSLALRREVARRHRDEPYDVVYQFSNIEMLAVPAEVAREVPLVIHPETHAAGELRFLLSERRLALRCQPAYTFAVATAVMWLRARVQRARIRRARLLVCISGVFRDHLVADYRFPLKDTVVVPNPVDLQRFPPGEKPLGDPPTVMVLGRIAVRKGIEDVVAATRLLYERGVDVRVRVIGGPGLWSDYTPLLEDLPGEVSEYLRRVPPAEIPQELARTDVLLQASRYEPFALTVAEALACGVPVVATSEVGAIEGVDREVVSEVEPGDVTGIADAIVGMIERVRSDPETVAATARSEAQRLFAEEVVCARISTALQRLVGGS